MDATPRQGRTDWFFLLAIGGLVALGLDAVATATDSWTGADLVERQLAWTCVGLLALAITRYASPSWFHTLAYFAYGISLALLVVVLRSEPINGSRSWLRAGPVGLQPSEVAKLAYVAALARYCSLEARAKSWLACAGAILLTVLPIGLILRQPDLGTALLFPPTMLAVLCSAGVPLRRLAVIVAMGVTALPVAWQHMNATQRARITGFLTQSDTGERPRDGGYQLYQSKLMIALGGATGSDVALDEHLPMAHNDFIFSVVAGRWGLVGATTLISLFGLLIGRGARIAERCVSPFAQRLATGIVALLATQGLVNLAMTVGLAPITGLTLPFVSYGGSSLAVSFLAAGILLNLAANRTWQHDWM